MKENVFDVLMYLFENYYMDDDNPVAPDRDSVQQELSKAGFPLEEIDRAFNWMEDLTTASSAPAMQEERSTRLFSETEMNRLDTECRGFILYLEQMGAIGAVAFDKTGTLTAGQPTVNDVIPIDGTAENELLQLAASLEAGSEHPLARAIVGAAEERSINLLPLSTFEAVSGLGARATVKGHSIIAGSMRFLETTVRLEEHRQKIDALQAEGKTVVLIAVDGHLAGAIGIADEVRTSSREAVTDLMGLGVKHTVMLTGDNATVAAAISHASGVNEYRAGLLPQDKVQAIHELIEQYGTVAMVGDGVNDAPALATATVGIAMGGAGSDTALETADVTLMADDLSRFPFTMGLSRAALLIIKANIAFALTIKLLAVLAVFPGWLTLWLAILSDMGATIIVTLNGMRLLRWRARRT